MADTQRIKQVIHHYLSNAHKFSKLEHPIEVHLQAEGRAARVFISDKGLGIPTHEQTHIWEQFYRVPSIEIQNGTEIGLGLGLHICHKIIEQHCGHVGVYSTQGKGSTFWFTLPLATKEIQLL
jgi:signal transduction histidine kinase